MERRRGSILIVVLFVMTVLSLAAVSFAYRAGLESRSARNITLLAKLRSHAASAANIAIARLAENLNDFDHPAEPWCAHRPLASEGWLAEWEGGQDGQPAEFVTDYQVIDEEGKLNIMFASSEALQQLGMSSDQIAALFDWMDQDDIASAEGAEGDYYLTRQNPHRCKNAPLESLDELLLVRGIGREDYLGEDLNHNRRLDSFEDDGELTYPPDNADGRLRMGWVDLLTVVGDGRININTAPAVVLETLPLSEGAAGQIIGFRQFDEDSSGNLEDHAFRSPRDIEQLQGLSDIDRDLLIAVSKFRSNHFRIFVQSQHIPTGLRYHLQVLVRTTGKRPEILQWKAGL